MDEREHSNDGTSDSEFDLLLDSYLAGSLSERDAAKLLQQLQSDPSLGDHLLDQLHVDAMLHEIADAQDSGGTGVSPVNHGRDAHATASPLVRQFAVAAAVLLVATVAFVVVRLMSTKPAPIAWPATQPASQPAEAITASVAVLTRSVDARWQSDRESTAPRVGTVLEPGWLRLDDGLVQIEFFNGAQVVLEGPAEVQLVSASEAFVRSGKLRAEVPPQARGFLVRTPQINVVDRGTSFGVDVSPAAAAVHVFRGLVELHEKDAAVSKSPPRDLTEGQAAAIDRTGGIRPMPVDAAVFATADDIDRRLDESQRRWLVRWQDASVVANADASLLVRFDFESAGLDRTLPNVAATAMNDAAIVGCGWSEGRWPGKGALEFRGVGDRVRVDVPGEYQSITCTAWLRVHGTDRAFNSIFMSDAFNAGATHWQILRDGRMRLGVGGGRPQDSDSPVVFSPERLGQWIHLAVVYDADAKQVTHYVDGRPVSRSAIQPRPLVIGRAEIGNWNPSPRRDGAPIRHFSGRIDEFAAYARALPDEEIATMYAVGAGLTETAHP